jgi:hypothetical protein
MEDSMPTGNTEILTSLDSGLAEIKRAYDAGDFQPIVEMDIVAHLYHFLIREGAAKQRNVHMVSRVAGLYTDNKVDLVVGDVVDQYREATYDAPRTTSPILALEAKFHSIDKSYSSSGTLLKDIRKDISKLAKARKETPGGLYVVLCVTETGKLKESDIAKAQEQALAKGIVWRYLRLRGSSKLEDHSSSTGAFVNVGTRRLRVGRILTASYGGREYRAEVTRKGTILYGGREYRSLTAAGCAATGNDVCEGPRFWGVS